MVSDFTSMTCEAEPILSAPSTLLAVSTTTVIPVCSKVSKPVASILTLYGSGIRCPTVYSPLAFDCAVTVIPFAVSVTVMVAFGTTAPDASVTVP